jgi:hypothetical protein
MSYRPITDVWFLARPKVDYYGAYPNGFLERARALLGISPFDPLLHVCGGKARDYPAKPRGFGPNDRTLDLDPALEPDYVMRADTIPRNLPHVFDEQQQCERCMQTRHEAKGHSTECIEGVAWASILADPPYTELDADHYAPGRKVFPKPNAILRAMLAAVEPGRRVGMLHYVLPQPPSKGVRFVACVAVIVGFNNRMRCYSVFEKE